MLLALLALPLLTGCATSSMWGWVLEDDGGPATTTTVYRTNTQTAEQSTRTYTTSGNSGAAFGVLLATPVTLAWDLVTLPLQIYRGDPPYERES
jgi:expansin (peptidoglycan-binding protein)